MAETYWNGEPTPARKVRVRVTEPVATTWWFADLVGTERAAVEVTYGGDTFLLDDEDGSGWRKVTEGRGGPRWPHRSLSGVVLGRCPHDLGRRPSWMSPDQYDPCQCLLAAGHEGEHECEHTRAVEGEA